MKFKTLKGISISITSQSAGKRKSKDKKRTCDAMQCDAMRRSLRKYEHFGMIDDSKRVASSRGSEEWQWEAWQA